MQTNEAIKSDFLQVANASFTKHNKKIKFMIAPNIGLQDEIEMFG